MADSDHTAMEITFSKPTTKDHQLILFGKDQLEEILKIDQEEFGKMTELEGSGSCLEEQNLRKN